MAKEKNFGDYHYFLYKASNPTYSFSTYTDVETGNLVGYIVGYDQNKQPKYRNWVFNYGPQRQIRVSKTEVDVEKKSALEFLRNHPECGGSKNGKYLGDSKETQVMVVFKEIDTAGDAKSAVATRSKVISAQAKALEVKDQDLKDMCSLIGVYDQSEEIMTHRLLDYASNNPDKFISLLEDPTRKTRSLIRTAINAGVLIERGKMIQWESTTIGVDEDDAVANLTKDAKLKQAIELNLKKFK